MSGIVYEGMYRQPHVGYLYKHEVSKLARVRGPMIGGYGGYLTEPALLSEAGHIHLYDTSLSKTCF